MNQHRFALALCALVSSLVLTDVANAYPTYSGTTLSKGYRPIDLVLNTLVEGTEYGGGYASGLNYTDGELSLTLVFKGIWTPHIPNTYGSYVNGGFAGYWVYELDTADYSSLSVDEYDNVITVSANSAGVEFGTFRYVGGFEPDTGLPTYDTPVPEDVFQLFTPTSGASLQATLLNGGLDFAVKLIGELLHVGPFVCDEEGDGECKSSPNSTKVLDELCDIDLDMDRSFPNCTADALASCGTVALDATSVPEPGTFALFGLGLASLGIGLRSRRKAPLA